MVNPTKSMLENCVQTCLMLANDNVFGTVSGAFEALGESERMTLKGSETPTKAYGNHHVCGQTPRIFGVLPDFLTGSTPDMSDETSLFLLN